MAAGMTNVCGTMTPMGDFSHMQSMLCVGWEMSTGQQAVLYGWEGNHWSAVTLLWPCIIYSVVYPSTG